MLEMHADIKSAPGTADDYDFAIVGAQEAVAALRYVLPLSCPSLPGSCCLAVVVRVACLFSCQQCAGLCLQAKPRGHSYQLTACRCMQLLLHALCLCCCCIDSLHVKSTRLPSRKSST